MKYSRNWTKQKPKSLIYQKTLGARRRPEEGLPRGQTPSRRGQTLARAWVASGPTRAPDSASSPIYSSLSGKPKRHERKSTKSSAAAVIAEARFGGHKSLFRHPAGTWKCPQSHLHRLHHHLH